MIQRTSRDNARTPMQWTSAENAGFTTGKPWLKVNGNHTEVNVEAELGREDGVLSFWKRMIALRKELAALKDGSFTSLYESNSIYAYAREIEGDRLIAIFNMTDKVQKMPKALQLDGEVIISNYGEMCDDLMPFEFELRRVGG